MLTPPFTRPSTLTKIPIYNQEISSSFIKIQSIHQMAITLLYNLPNLITNNHNLWFISILFVTLLYFLYRRKTTIYLLDYTCYKPPASYRTPKSMYAENIELEDQLDQESRAFQIKILEKSGLGEETCIAPSLTHLPIIKSHILCINEAEMVIFSIVKLLLEKNNIAPKAIDILITNTCVFSPTPSLAAMVINKFKMRSNIMCFNLSGMGCSAGIISVGLAKDLLSVHKTSLALIISTEIMNINWCTSKNRSMLMTNCLFRLGGVAILMSSRDQDRRKAKYTLEHVVRTNRARDDQAYACVFQQTDNEKKTGVSISKNIVSVAGHTLKTNIAHLGPKVLPLTQQFRYGLFLVLQKLKISRRGCLFVPDFGQVFEHFCIHAGGKAVISAIEKGLKLKKEDVEASKMSLYRFGNTSSSSIWYGLSYLEAKGRMKRGDRVWQIAFGSGFKCNSAVWKCVGSIEADEANAWSDEIHKYPVDVPDT